MISERYPSLCSGGNPDTEDLEKLESMFTT